MTTYDEFELIAKPLGFRLDRNAITPTVYDCAQTHAAFIFHTASAEWWRCNIGRVIAEVQVESSKILPPIHLQCHMHQFTLTQRM